MTEKSVLIQSLIHRIETLTMDELTRLSDILNKWQKGRQRRHQRFDTALDVDFVVKDRFYQSRATNISAGGIFIAIDETFDTDEPLSIVIATSQTAKPFKLKGKIIRLTQEGIAVRFDNISPYFARILENAIVHTATGGSKKKRDTP